MVYELYMLTGEIQITVLVFDLILTEPHDWMPSESMATISQYDTQPPLKKIKADGNQESDEELKNRLLHEAQMMNAVLDRSDWKDPRIGRDIWVVKGPYKAFKGTLRAITARGEAQVDLDALLIRSGQSLTFDLCDITFAPVSGM